MVTEDERTIRRYERLRYVCLGLDNMFSKLSALGLYAAANQTANAHGQADYERKMLHPKYIEAKNRQSKGVSHGGNEEHGN